MYALNLANDGRILSATYDRFAPENLPRIESLPSGGTDEEKNIYNWLYVEGRYVFDPLPEPEKAEPAETLESRVETLETSNAELAETVDMILSGVTADE